jgi:FkbM family methyltransferase
VRSPSKPRWIDAAKRLGFTVDRVQAGTYILRRGGRRLRRVTVGEGVRAVTVLVHPKATRRGWAPVQKQLWEFFSAEQVTWLLENTGVNLVIDVGANHGQFAGRLRKAGYRGRIASFEPGSRHFAKLAEAAEGDPLWSVHHCALGAEEGEAELHLTEGPLSSLQEASTFGKEWSSKIAEATTETVQVRTLGSMLDELSQGLDPVRAFLKMDTQGFDHHVFAGAGKILDRVVGLQSELSSLALYDGAPMLTDQLRVYEDAGFETIGIYPVARDGKTLRVIEFDLVMVRAQEVRSED